jgi:RNA polymerase sigma-70 factor (ECF subfamily)
MPDTSLTLLDLARHGDAPSGWDRLVRLYEPVIRSWLRHCGLQPADVDDVCQDVLQRLSQSLQAFRHGGVPGSFRSWLRSMTMHAMSDYWRRKRSRIPSVGVQVSMTELLHTVPDDHDELRRRWDQEYNTALVHGALKLVKPHFDATTWESFRRVTFEGQSPQEVASALSISVNSVYLARSRVVRRLRAEIRGLLD